jgi:hypothetical protein
MRRKSPPRTKKIRAKRSQGRAAGGAKVGDSGAGFSSSAIMVEKNALLTK